MTEEELREIATSFRTAIEMSDLSAEAIGEEASGRMERFPDSACAEVTRILGLFLTEEFGLTSLVHKGAQIEKGEKWFGTHEWLEHNGIKIDITADQFEMVDERVIVSSNSEFHNEFANKIFDYSCPFSFEHDPDWLKPFYDEVVSKYRSLNDAEGKESDEHQ